MRPVDRILHRSPPEAKASFAVRRFGTTQAEAAAVDAAAAAVSGGTTENLTTGNVRVRELNDGETFNRFSL